MAEKERQQKWRNRSALSDRAEIKSRQPMKKRKTEQAAAVAVDD